MTKDEYRDMYEALHFGHEVEFVWNGVRYYLEQGENEIQIWVIEGDSGTLLSSVHADTRNDLVVSLFEEKMFSGRSLDDIMSEVSITDID